ncbi:uncharacterized protein LOC129584013 [Paramacrobiotus metropolitanus]|uniref:uncharacterized protein LOC129584013 n=1 Tax=Paramacrobiotus metropolitanus TaxID=2943436 RepID=UPI00244564AF|nr:uncharacterized protein LOC129584013 [Paramacrobiotus metropolitanus]XP_055332069.1 uncharacterized protein LOC129584013 [Paramacrobiotus metropolitanus]
MATPSSSRSKRKLDRMEADPVPEIVEVEQTVNGAKGDLRGEKLRRWMKRTAEERFNLTWSANQKATEKVYASPDYHFVPKYKPDDAIVVYYRPFYYDAVVLRSVDPHHCPDYDKDIPAYKIRYTGWGKSFDEDIVEWDAFCPSVNGQNFPLQLLYAHYWNLLQIRLVRKLSSQQKKGIFALQPVELARCERQWQEEMSRDYPDENLTFAQWIGVEK